MQAAHEVLEIANVTPNPIQPLPELQTYQPVRGCTTFTVCISIQAAVIVAFMVAAGVMVLNYSEAEARLAYGGVIGLITLGGIMAVIYNACQGISNCCSVNCRRCFANSIHPTGNAL